MRISIVVNNAVERVVLHQFRTAVLGDKMKKTVDQYFKADKIGEVVGKRLLQNDELVTPIASFIQK